MTYNYIYCLSNNSLSICFKHVHNIIIAKLGTRNKITDIMIFYTIVVKHQWIMDSIPFLYRDIINADEKKSKKTNFLILIDYNYTS